MWWYVGSAIILQCLNNNEGFLTEFSIMASDAPSVMDEANKHLQVYIYSNLCI